MINRQWLSEEIRWGQWNGNEFQCVDASAANEMLAEIELLRGLLREAGDELRPFGFGHLCDRIDAALAGASDQQGVSNE